MSTSLTPRKTEILPPPIKGRSCQKAPYQGKPKHRVTLGRETLAYYDLGGYNPFPMTIRPSPLTLAKRVRAWTEEPSKKTKTKGIKTKTKTKGKVKMVDFSLNPSSKTPSHCLSFDPSTKELTQINLSTHNMRWVLPVSSIHVKPPLPRWKTSSFYTIPLPDLRVALEEAEVGGLIPPIIQSAFYLWRLTTTPSNPFPSGGKTIQDVIFHHELDRLKGRVAIGVHGTTKEAAARIMKNGFDTGRFGSRGSIHGKGVYLTACGDTAVRYGAHQIIVAFCTSGKTSLISHGSKGLDTVVVSDPKTLLPLMWIY